VSVRSLPAAISAVSLVAALPAIADRQVQTSSFTRRGRGIRRALALAAVAFLVSCSSDEEVLPTAPSTATTIVGKSNFSFTPVWTRVPAGSTVTFTFESVAHAPTFTGALGSPANIAATANASVTRVFTTKGIYNYTCTVHTFMTGRITVE
jgi:plastocyanin